MHGPSPDVSADGNAEGTLGIACVQRERLDAVGELTDVVLRRKVIGFEAQRLQRWLGGELRHDAWENRLGVKNLQVRPPPYDVNYT